MEFCRQHGYSRTFSFSKLRPRSIYLANVIIQVAIETIGWQYYLVFLIISAIIVPIVFFFYPETMGRSLEELEMMFAEGRSIPSIVRESTKPLTGSLMPDSAMEKGDRVDEDEYVN